MSSFVSPNREDLFGANDSATIQNAIRAADNYFNLTVTDIDGKVTCLAETKNLSL